MTRKIYIFTHLALLLMAIFASSCSNSTIYAYYEEVPQAEWHKDSALHFSFAANDTMSIYNIGLDIRHNQQYPFQNIWLFTDLYSDSTLLTTDTLEYYLANQRGEWLGNGAGRLRDMPCLWLNDIQLSGAERADSEYHIFVRHGMREDILYGVEAVGVNVTRQKR